MCGISGIFNFSSGKTVPERLLQTMNDRQEHRGPDEAGLYVNGITGLGHRRLSIIDISTGQQPLYNEDRSVVIVFNGEIFNYHELMDELKAHGHVFATGSDTEVIVHGWEQWREGVVDRLRGMFAFAIWDTNRKQLFIARDRLGVKPLYYSFLPDGDLIFASELKSLMMHPDLERKIDPEQVENYFAYGYVPDPGTIFRSVRKLEPGHWMTISADDKRVVERKYWDVPFQEHGLSEQDALEETVVRLREAVRIRMESEVPLGAFLSGGVDSSAVVAMMSELNGDNSVKTCSIAFGEKTHNESEYARMVAEQYGTEHYVDNVEAYDYSLLDRLVDLYDEPFADSSALPTYRVCELAKKRVTVVLSGDGGDENFAGYRRHRWHMNEEALRSRLPMGMRRAVFGALGSLYPKLDWAPKIFRAKSTFQALARDSVAAYMHSVSVTSDQHRQGLFSADFHSDLQGYHASEVFHRHISNSPTDHPLSMIQYLDFKTYLPGDILTKVDRASMAHALEVRVPILDHKYVEWISGLSPDLKLRGSEGKYIFKKALEKYLPEEILYRPKMGFAVPVSGWFRNELRDKVRSSLLSEEMADAGIFDMNYVRRLVTDHQSGVSEHSAVIWALLMFQGFLKKTG